MALFPIHDLAREADVRMRRRRAVLLLAGIAVVAWVLVDDKDHRSHYRTDDDPISFSMPPISPIPAIPPMPAMPAMPSMDGMHVHIPALPRIGADGPMRRFQASGVTIDIACASSITLLPGPGLGDQLILSVHRGQEGALEQTDISNGVVSHLSGCDNDADFTLQAAPEQTLRIVQHGSVDIHGGRFVGPVTIDSTGSGSVALESTGPLEVHQAGGDVTIGEVTASLTATLNGSGDLRIARGHLSTLSATLNGSGDLSMQASVAGETHLTLNASGAVTAGRLDGIIQARTSGSGDITLAAVTAPSVELMGSGSGDIVIDRGRIGTLNAQRTGSGDLRVHAEIGNATVEHHGSGDVSLPNVTGHRIEVSTQDSDAN